MSKRYLIIVVSANALLIVFELLLSPAITNWAVNLGGKNFMVGFIVFSIPTIVIILSNFLLMVYAAVWLRPVDARAAVGIIISFLILLLFSLSFFLGGLRPA